MQMDDRMLSQHIPITFLSSFTQLRDSEAKKNLYNARLLMVEGQTLPDAQAGFSSMENLTGEAASSKSVRSRWLNYGVLNINSGTRISGLNETGTYIDLTRRPNQFHRIQVEELFEETIEPNFIALNNVPLQLSSFTRAFTLGAFNTRVDGARLSRNPFAHRRFRSRIAYRI